ncbi:unnamed protein product [Caenorhabditis auriculariae]|uniref:Galectin domain-containing protein n=1 Tax=Caenorhabditis auriculariae TaxID=2777116 RepID=A0A8S1GSW0_9PELO|nr:unnamed protein product [Caenorhabditis auriculariae]
MLGVFLFFAALIGAAHQEDVMIRRLHCSRPDAPLTMLANDWPLHLAFERPLKIGDILRYSFVFNSDGKADSTVDLRSYDESLPFDEDLITLHLRFRSQEKRLVVNAHETPGVWQSDHEQSIPWKDHWAPNHLITIEIRYTNAGFEIYELDPNGAQPITTFPNKHSKHDLFTASEQPFFINAAQLICNGN